MPIGPTVVVVPAARLRGSVEMPGDKSISHRYALLAAIARGRSVLHHYAPGGDCRSTLTCLAALGVHIERSDERGRVAIEGRGSGGLSPPAAPLDCGNSGSTMRMLAGILAGHPFASRLVGDDSLTRRPMRRVVAPLVRMGARLATAPEGRPPLDIQGADLSGIDYTPEVPSAQVKSAVLLAGLHAHGVTHVSEAVQTRDHTERAMAAFGVELTAVDGQVTLPGTQTPTGIEARVPGDVSSAVFFMAGAGMRPGSDLVIDNVGLNPTRTAVVDVLRRAGVNVTTEITGSWQGEPVGRLHVTYGSPTSLEIVPSEVPLVIDELPALAVLAAAGGELRVTGAGELRVKESDRIASVVAGLRAVGVEAEELPDGFHVSGRRGIAGGVVDAHHDHRLAMAFAVAGLAARAPVTVTGADAAAVSFPTFFDQLERLRG